MIDIVLFLYKFIFRRRGMDIISKFNKGIDLLKTKYLMKFNQKNYLGNKYKINYLI